MSKFLYVRSWMEGGWGKPEARWMKVIRIDLKKGNLSKDLTSSRLEWTNIIHVADPNIDGTRL